MLKENGTINWVTTLASIARDKGEYLLADYIGKFGTQVDTVIHATPIEGVNEIVKAGKFNITVMPEATCDGCQ